MKLFVLHVLLFLFFVIHLTLLVHLILFQINYFVVEVLLFLVFERFHYFFQGSKIKRKKLNDKRKLFLKKKNI